MPSKSSDDTLVTVSEAAELLDCSARTVTRLQADGRLTPVYEISVRRKRVRRYRRAEVLALLQRAAS